ncbi:hypothetical protein [Clostridium estertheticum]|uniref:Uncharacterized protein n=1 Tax=Clostridium estertheticum TaxID=238834 RepID=A0A7Y3WUI8_9CLOT|nr:hypothetical protein [Clostridium estertheticum]NNU78164.1 hypothetical protein [Clostridium estertheticum]WBL47723.1 hypothetical protein LOR37_03270 [Clostridium estertheticum]
MKKCEEEIFERLDEEHMNKESNNVVWGIIRERIRVAIELWELGSIDVDKISEITGLTVKDVMEANGNNLMENKI